MIIQLDPFESFNEKIEEEAREVYRIALRAWLADNTCNNPREAAYNDYKKYIEYFSKKPLDNTEEK